MKCKICGSNTKKIDENNNYTLWRCKNCGFVFKPNIHITYEALEEEAYTVFNFDRSKEVKEIVLFIKKYFKNLNDLYLVEIGSGTGVLLHNFKSYGIKVDGFEPSKIAYNMAKREFDIQLIEGYFKNEKLNKKPQIILLYDVIEHLNDLEMLLLQIKKAMNKETILIIKSGNPSSINARLFIKKWSYLKSSQHISFYTKKSMEILCNRTGLRLDNFYVFKHAYGGVAVKSILKNFIRSGINYIINSEKYTNRFNIQLANDHFIAVMKKN